MTAASVDEEQTEHRDSRLRRWFGPLTTTRIVVLLAVVAFLGGAIGYSFRTFDTSGDP